jgi:hypothetical protein
MSVSTTERLVAIVAALLASACRFGGPSGDPTTIFVDGGAGAAGTGGQGGAGGDGDSRGGRAGDTGAGGGAGEGGSRPEAGTDASAEAGADASSEAGDATVADVNDDTAAPEGGVDRDASVVDVGEAGTGDSGGDSADGATSCLPPFSSAICDPVCNTGCPALFRCDIADTPRTGVCVGSLLSSATEGMPCTRTTLTDDCAASLSCIEGICRRLCYRDADCLTSGTCCNTVIELDAGASGYRRCAPCGP